jgi:hypothetical protein
MSSSRSLCSAKLSKEWFEDSSSEEEVDDNPDRHRRKRRRENGCGSGKVGPVMVELTVKITSVKVAGLSPTLTARVCAKFGLGAVPISLDTSSSRQSKKKGKGKVKNWRERPVRARARANAPFHRTLPGELSRKIIVARIVSSGVNVGAANLSCHAKSIY